MGLSIWQIVLVVFLFLLLFGRGKIPALMSDLAEGIKGFKKGIVDEEEHDTQSPSVKTADQIAAQKTNKKVPENTTL